MNAKDMTTQSNELTETKQRKRRHWYDHEKLAILSAFDKNELNADPKKANNIIDPKSGQSLPVFLIEAWRDSFRALGLIKKAAIEIKSQTVIKPTATETKVNNQEEFQKLLVNILIENQRLKEMVNSYKKGAGRKSRILSPESVTNL